MKQKQRECGMNNLADAQRVGGFPPHTCPDAAEIVSAMTEPVGAADVLEALVKELKRAGIWGRVGEISWARDTRDGLLLQWVPAH
ncbi:hypothetical protein [Hansschlegelia plantiphila]|nr:hypothetical protein [Hansschlegelia plantiphila]